jgi:hypothetical protein
MLANHLLDGQKIQFPDTKQGVSKRETDTLTGHTNQFPLEM